MTNPAWARRREAARTYRPKRIRLLLVAESPPDDEGRYFYAAGTAVPDDLFGQVCTVLFEAPPQGDKAPYLKELRRRGAFLVDLKPDAPRAHEDLEPYVAPFLLNLEALAPERVILITVGVHDALHPAILESGLPVVDVRIPFPSAEHQADFRRTLRQAVVRAGLESLIRALPPAKAAGAS